jgi:AAA15 family ATPase/GTPase
MRLKTLLIRFYKSFNFDYLRKNNSEVRPKPWELIDEKWYPYVSIPIDSKVTNVVGANESGKSHLLSAIEKGISGQGIERQDFCRYSQYFTLQKGKIRFPDFGFEWGELSDKDVQSVKVAGNIPEEIEFKSFYLFRNNREHLSIYISEGNSYELYQVNEKSITALTNIFPRVFRMNSDVALPKSVEIRALANGSIRNNQSKLESLTRASRLNFFDSWHGISDYFRDQATITNAALQIMATFSPYITESDRESSKEDKQVELARRLIVDVAKIDPEYLSELYDAIRDEEEGHANAIIQKINESLKNCLNFPQWWAQDKNFQLVVSSREYELVFTIRDRTGTEYSFDERSSGLKYFLSYYIQYLSHQPSSDCLLYTSDAADEEL